MRSFFSRIIYKSFHLPDSPQSIRLQTDTLCTGIHHSLSSTDNTVVLKYDLHGHQSSQCRIRSILEELITHLPYQCITFLEITVRGQYKGQFVICRHPCQPFHALPCPYIDTVSGSRRHWLFIAYGNQMIYYILLCFQPFAYFLIYLSQNFRVTCIPYHR